MPTRLLVWLALALLAPSGTARSDSPIEAVLRVTGVPDQLTVPFPTGSNCILTAAITGAETKSAWLATERDAAVRIFLTRVGDGEFQINLADKDVGGVLATLGRDRFRVFGELDDGRVLTSLPVGYAIRGRPPAPMVGLRVVAHEKGGHSHVATHDGRHWTQRPSSAWLDADAVNTIDVTFAAPAVGPVRLLVGDQVRDFSSDDGGVTFSLEFDAALARAFTQHGSMIVEPASLRQQFTYQCRPNRLEFDGNSVTFKVGQRSHKSVPGSGDFLDLWLGDITGGTVTLSLSGADRTRLVTTELLRQGESVRFDRGVESYALVVHRLHNLAFGEDWAEITVWRAAAFETARIAALLEHLATSDVTFLRAGEPYTGAEAADHLRRKLRAAGGQVGTYAEFVERIASRSSTTHEAYLVAPPDGEPIAAAQWIASQAAAIDARVAE